MQRVLVLAAMIAVVVVGNRVRADLENQQRGGEGGVYTSKLDGLQMVVPRTWHATDQASYPGVLLWLEHGQPEGHIVLTADPFTRQLYCSWLAALRERTALQREGRTDATCQNPDSLPMKFACALRTKLIARRMHVGLIQAGPKENELAGIETVWFEYDDSHHFVRQAVAVTEDRAVSLLLSTSSTDARAGYVRAFEQALRTLAPWSEETAPIDSGIANGPMLDAGLADANLLVDASVDTATPATLSSAPTTKIHPVGSCAQQ